MPKKCPPGINNKNKLIYIFFFNFYELTGIPAASRGRQQQEHSGDGQDVQRRASCRRRRRGRRRAARLSSGHHRARDCGAATRSPFRTLYGGTRRFPNFRLERHGRRTNAHARRRTRANERTSDKRTDGRTNGFGRYRTDRFRGTFAVPDFGYSDVKKFNRRIFTRVGTHNKTNNRYFFKLLLDV